MSYVAPPRRCDVWAHRSGTTVRVSPHQSAAPPSSAGWSPATSSTRHPLATIGTVRCRAAWPADRARPHGARLRRCRRLIAGQWHRCRSCARAVDLACLAGRAAAPHLGNDIRPLRRLRRPDRRPGTAPRNVARDRRVHPRDRTDRCLRRNRSDLASASPERSGHRGCPPASPTGDRFRMSGEDKRHARRPRCRRRLDQD